MKGVNDVRYVCLSDLHLGEEDSLLTGVSAIGGADPLWGPVPVLELLAARLADLVEEQEEKPTLILLGDILELALATDNLAVMAFERFLRVTMRHQHLFERIVYVPGNHDHHLWESAREAQYIHNYLLGDEADPNVPLGSFLEPSWHTSRMFVLEKPQRTIDVPLIRALVQRFPELSGLPVQAAYPHFALRDRTSSRAIVFHHGHLLEELYHAMSTLRYLLFREDAPDARLDDIESLNFAWIDFFWSTMGRSGQLGTRLETIFELLNQDPERLQTYADNFAAGVAERYDLPFIPTDWLEAKALRVALRAALRAGKAARDAQRRLGGEAYDDDLRAAILAHIGGPLRRALVEECVGASPFGYVPRVPGDLTFVTGHTHKPYSTVEHLDSTGSQVPRRSERQSWVRLYNLGGWVVDTVDPEPRHGAAVLLISDTLDTASIRLYQEGAVTRPAVEECLRPGDEMSAFARSVAARITKRRGEWDHWSRTVEEVRGQRAASLRARLERLAAE